MTEAEKLLAELPDEPEIFAQEEQVCVIDNNLRTISIPAGISILGVEGDENVYRIYFRMPRMYGDFDLSQFGIRINFRNAQKEKDTYLVEDAFVAEDAISFTWLASRRATKYKGNTEFIVCLRMVDAAGIVTKEFNTTLAKLPVLEGLEPDEIQGEEYVQDVVAQLLDITRVTSEKAVSDVNDTASQQIAKVQEEGAQQIIAVQQTAKDLVGYEALFPLVIKEEQKGVDIHVEGTAEFPFVGMSVYGKTTQDGVPTPDNPVPLTSASDKGSIDVYSFGTNLYDLDSAFPNQDDITVSRSGNGVRLVRNNLKAYASMMYHLKLKPNTTYTLGTNININAGKGKACLGIRLKKANDQKYPANLTATSYSTLVSGLKKVTFSTSEENIYCQVDLYASMETAIDVDVTFTDIMFCEGNTILPWEPFKGQTATIQTPNGLSGIPVSFAGNYTDANGQQWVCDEIDLARGKYIQRTQKQLLDGTGRWSISSAGNNIFYVVEDKIKRIGTAQNYALCDMYRYHGVGNSKMDDKTIKIGFSDDETHMLLYIKDSAYSTAKELKSALAENPVTVLYMLENPIETDLTPEEVTAYKALRTKEYTTNIYNDEDAHMHVKYALDTQKYIDKKIIT